MANIMENSNNFSMTSEKNVDLTLADPSQRSKKFVQFLLWRFAGFIGLLLVGVIFVNIVVSALPGDPWTLMIGDGNLTESKLAYIESQKLKWGFDEPFITRVCYSIRNMLTGDLGESLTVQRGSPVLEVIQSRGPRTSELLMFSLLLAVPVSVGLGILSGKKKGTWTDRIILGFAGVCFIIPLSMFGMLLQYFFAIKWELLDATMFQSPMYITWMPDITGFRLLDSLLRGEMEIFIDTLAHLILPASILAAAWTAILVILIRRIVILIKSKNMHFPTRNYIRMFLVFFYMSVITVVIETTFNLNGSGMLTIAAINAQDFFLILALVIRNVFFFQLIAFIVDIVGGIVQFIIKRKHPSSSAGMLSISADAHKFTFADPSEPKLLNGSPEQMSKIGEDEKRLVSWSWKSMLLRPGVLIGAFILLICYVMVLLTPILFEYSDLVLVDDTALGWAPPDDTHLLGTARFGRDVLGRVLWGARIPIGILFPLCLVLGILGYLLGFLCIGKIPFLDNFLDYLLKIVLLVPGISFIIIYIAIIGPNITTIITLIGGFVFLGSMMLGHRAIGEHLRYSNSTHRKGQILKSSIPQIFAFSLILSVLAQSLLFTLGFLGWWDPTLISWGNDINYARGRIYDAPWAAGWP
ncbi:MAG: ABC transporter permease subunit, partial [Promethearchaeota archaeon]